MANQIIQGLIWVSIAFLQCAVPAPTSGLTSSNPAITSKPTQEPVTSSEIAVNFTQDDISSAPHPSTDISTVTASKDELFHKLHQIKIKEAELQSKLDDDSVVAESLATTKTIIKTTTDFPTTTPLTSSSHNSTTSFTKTSLHTIFTSPYSLPKTDKSRYITSTVTSTELISQTATTLKPSQPHSSVSMTTDSMATVSNLASKSPIKEQNTVDKKAISKTKHTDDVNDKDNRTHGDDDDTDDDDDDADDDEDDDTDGDPIDYSDEYDGEEDWFKTNELVWDFDDDKSFEEEYSEVYEPGSGGDKYREFFLNDIKPKPLRLPWE